MRALSASTVISDPYRAGVALGTALRPLAPEIVFLFASIHYGTPELLEGLFDALEDEAVLVVGNSGDGFYETAQASDLGVAALGLNSAGTVRWCVERVDGLRSDVEAATRAAITALQVAEMPRLALLFSDFRLDASRVEAAVSDCGFPLVGGLAADDNRMARCHVYLNRAVLEDALLLVAAYGRFDFSIAIGNSLQAIGRPGLVEAAEGSQVHRIDGMDAMDFIERETGKPVLQSDRGILSLTVLDRTADDEKCLRSIVPDFSGEVGTLGLYGGIEAGKRVQVCLAQPDALVAEVYAIAHEAAASGMPPAAALVVSCSGRKALLGGQIGHEVSALGDSFPGGVPLAGYPSFGEFGPLRRGGGYTRNLFHNMTYVLLLFGR